MRNGRDWRRAGVRAGPRAAVLVAAASLAGCAQSACSQPDVLAFVDKARQSHDIYAIGLTDGLVRQSPMPSRQAGMPLQPGRPNMHAAVCSAWLLSRNPAYQPGNGQAEFVRTQQDFWVAKIAEGYQVGIYRN